jgi:hypothetical protein
LAQENFHGLTQDKTYLSDGRGARYLYTEIESFYEYKNSRPWIKGKKVLKDGSLSKNAQRIYGDWKVAEAVTE